MIVRLAEDDGALVFSVADDGRGFDPAVTPQGTGIQNMTDRLDALGGTLTLRSAPSHGTTVTGRIPTRLLRQETTADEARLFRV